MFRVAATFATFSLSAVIFASAVRISSWCAQIWLSYSASFASHSSKMPCRVMRVLSQEARGEGKKERSAMITCQSAYISSNFIDDVDTRTIIHMFSQPNGLLYT
jgi:hypothetical protein